ncbi:hypothetical protein vseg_000861 [Gypsophila vaccaria]
MRQNESSKGRGIALKAEFSDLDEVLDDELATFANSFKNSLRGKLGSKRPTTIKRFFGKKLPYGDSCYKCGESDHVIKNCPQWKEIKSKEKREKIKNDSSDEEEDLCLTAIESRQPKSKPKMRHHVCLMGKSDYSDSDEDNEEEDPEVSFASLKAQVKTFSKTKLVPLFEQFLDEHYNQSKE